MFRLLCAITSDYNQLMSPTGGSSSSVKCPAVLGQRMAKTTPSSLTTAQRARRLLNDSARSRAKNDFIGSLAECLRPVDYDTSSAKCVRKQRRLPWSRQCVHFERQNSQSHAGEHCRIFGDERGQLWVRGFELFNGLFQFVQNSLNTFGSLLLISDLMR